ncbi:MAG: helix-turn-helix domain-containing protein [Caulobacteraceae bacterium]|nr:helix-turn-helix domain-containing protein [Caulobacteraceae bacterium]
MKIDGWKERLASAVQASGKSLRAISLAANAGPGYLFSVLNDGKDPSVEYLSRLCEALGVSLSYVLYGVNITPETERLMRLAEENPEARANLIAILERKPG